MKEKVFAYILRDHEPADRLLAFAHKEFPDVPLQVPGGTVNEGEPPLEALKREVWEESGLDDLYDIRKLGEAELSPDESDEDFYAHFYVCRTAHPSSEWEHEVKGTGEDRGLVFSYRWLGPQEALLVYDYYFHVYMRPEYLPTLFTEDSMLGLSNEKVSLMPYTELWRENFEEEKKILEREMGHAEIEHVGSTSIPWVPAKPIIDIAVESAEPEQDIEAIQNCGYEYRGEMGVQGRYYFVKGPDHNRTHHIHMFKERDAKYRDHLLFRDHLIDNRDTAEEYGKLKLKLWRKYRGERRKYTEAKSDFIGKVLKRAEKSVEF